MESTARTTLDAPAPNSAPDRCTTRARRIASIKFVALPLDCARSDEAAPAVPAGNRSVLRRLLNPLSWFRASGRLEAARP